MRACSCGGAYVYKRGKHGARWIDTVIEVDAEFYECDQCGRTKFRKREGLRLQELARMEGSRNE